MRITGIGHASVLIETAHGTILTDPWVNPAYFGSWFPFPDNSQLDWDRLGQADYLFVSHLHRDHFDPEHLRKHVSKKATVLLPDYPTHRARGRAARARVHLVRQARRPASRSTLDGLQVMIQSLDLADRRPDRRLVAVGVRRRAPAAQPERRAARPTWTRSRELGPVDGYLVQFSGAIWFPMVYELPARAKQALGLTKRERQFDRTLRYIEELRRSLRLPDRRAAVLPRRGAVGLQRHLRRRVEHLPRPARLPRLAAEQGSRRGPAAAARHASPTWTEPGCPVDAPVRPGRRSTRSPRRRPPTCATCRRGGCPRSRRRRRPGRIPEIDVLAALHGVVHPAAGGGRPHGRPASTAACGSPARTPSAATSTCCSTSSRARCAPYAGEKVRYRFRTRRAYVEQLVAEHEIDWVNSLFLSCRFSAHRIGPYNEFVYVFFKCLSEERLQLRRGLVRRAERRRGGRDDHAGRLGRAAPLPAPEGRPDPVRLDRRTACSPARCTAGSGG